jgi:catechol 2,3-dioxygenase-like lactoylglutathione lyase family enzyme
MPLRALRNTVRLGVVILIATSLLAQSNVKRPRILGIAHVAFNVADLSKARAFYNGFLGFDEPFSLKRQDGTDWIAYVKVNDLQYLELFAGNPENRGQLAHIAIYTDSASQMKSYLESRGMRIVAKLHQGQTGDYFFSVADPDGHLIEIVEYRPDSWTAREKGNFMPASRISNHLLNVGLLVGSQEAALKFYGDILGFQEVARGTNDQSEANRIDMRVPNGNDYLELIPYQGHPSPEQQKAQTHVCLERSNLQKTVTDLQARSATVSYSYPLSVRVGNNSPSQADLVDPDGVHIKMLEPPINKEAAVSGVPAR